MSRRLLQALAVVGALLLVVGIVWAYGERHDPPSAVAGTILGLGTLLCLTSLAGAVLVERRPDGLQVPAATSLPAPHWAGPAALVGLCDLTGGAYASRPLAVLGAALIVMDLGWAGLSRQRPRPQVDRGTVVAARRLRTFAAEHSGAGGGAEVQVAAEHLGRGLVRLVVVGADGAFGDVVVRGVERGETALALSGLPRVAPDDRAFGAAVRTGAYEWRRMAGQQLGRSRA